MLQGRFSQKAIPAASAGVRARVSFSKKTSAMPVTEQAP
jgi:hypothetical protein